MRNIGGEGRVCQKFGSQTRHCYSRLVSHLSAVDVVDDEVEFVGSLERVVEADEERMVHVADQHVALGHHVRRLVLLEHVRLTQHLHGVQLVLGLVARQQHLSIKIIIIIIIIARTILIVLSS